MKSSFKRKNKGEGKAKPKILVHICCAPDALYVMGLLKGNYEPAGYFYNPNIHPEEEYALRLKEVKRVAGELGFPFHEGEYDINRWKRLTEKHKNEPEKGRRCDICYAIRLERTARKAAELDFDSFTTVMSLSPWKKADVLNRIGRMFGRRYGLHFLEANFKKKDGFKKSIELSREHCLYRQDYCGCEYSQREREEKKKNKGYALRVSVSGVVQGVGFRPAVYRLAEKLALKGWIKNIGFGVEIHLESREKSAVDDFLKALEKEKPPLAQIEEIKAVPTSFRNYRNFTIRRSKKGERFVFISPDISICDNCRTELLTPENRRFLYPFINCTDCGPRYTIVKSLPYDRKETTMEHFSMCAECAEEYSNPLDRRYHAQPVACPRCGPQVMLKEARSGKRVRGGIKKAVELIKNGKILAVKGLGGFHLVCDALNPEAVRRLRRIKARKTKPLALMAKDLTTVEKYAFLNARERELLLSARRPIVLLRKKRDIRGIAPYLMEMGFMLPYTPLHYLLLQQLELIVATSSNKKDAPIMKEEEEGISILCDCILTHNRPIHIRTDDSVMKVVAGKPLFLRRARGYVPYPQRVPDSLHSTSQVLALGGELKDTLSVYKRGYVVTSQFLGDLDEYQNYAYFEETLNHLLHLFQIKPEVVVTDLHPNFHTTRFAQRSGLTHLQVQHHFAHLLAPLLEHGLEGGKKVLGVSFDGYGYGTDGAAWGGEFLIADYNSFTRFAHLKYVPLPGGDLAAKQPWRMALSYLRDTFGPNIPQVESLKKISNKKIALVMSIMESSFNSPPTSSCGRLFDAVSFLTGLAPREVEFEAEAPMRLEAAAEEGLEESYTFSISREPLPLKVSFEATIEGIIEDLKKGAAVSRISSKFHNTLAQAVVRVALRVEEKFGLDTVVVAGGVFLNRVLLSRTCSLLEKSGFRVLRPVKYSPNDESLSIGQVAYALARLKSG